MRMRVIVFDDADYVQEFFKTVLEECGYEVLVYSDPEECLLQHEHECVCDTHHVCADAIISDVDMPNVSGLQFVDSQKKKGCKIKNIAFMSGRWTAADMNFARKLGCKILYKPFTLETVLDWLDECKKRMDKNRLLSNWFIQEPVKSK